MSIEDSNSNQSYTFAYLKKNNEFTRISRKGVIK